MKANLYLLIGVIVLYLAPALAIKAVYGPSYSVWEGENCWIPDAKGGWAKQGEPTDPAPDQPSAVVPISILYIPIFLPTMLLVLFMFTPLSRKLERKKNPQDSSDPPEDNPAEQIGSDQK